MSTAYWVLGAGDPEMEMIERLLRESMQHVVYALHGGERVRPESAYRADGLSESIPAGARVYRVECDGPAIPTGAQVIDHHRPGDPGYGRPPAEFMAASSIGQTIAELARLGQLPWTGDTCGSYDDPPMSERGRFLRWLPLRPSADSVPGYTGPPDKYGLVDEEWWARHARGQWRVCVTAPGETGGDWGDDPSEWASIPDGTVFAAAADHCPDAARRGECPGVDPDALVRWQYATPASQEAAEEALR